MINQEAVNCQAEQRLKNRKSRRDTNIKQLTLLKAGKAFNWTKVENLSRLAVWARRLGLCEAVEAANVDGAASDARGWFSLVGRSEKAVVGERVSITKWAKRYKVDRYLEPWSIIKTERRSAFARQMRPVMRQM